MYPLSFLHQNQFTYSADWCIGLAVGAIKNLMLAVGSFLLMQTPRLTLKTILLYNLRIKAGELSNQTIPIRGEVQQSKLRGEGT